MPLEIKKSPQGKSKENVLSQGETGDYWKNRKRIKIIQLGLSVCSGDDLFKDHAFKDLLEAQCLVYSLTFLKPLNWIITRFLSIAS